MTVLVVCGAEPRKESGARRRFRPSQASAARKSLAVSLRPWEAWPGLVFPRCSDHDLVGSGDSFDGKSPARQSHELFGALFKQRARNAPPCRAGIAELKGSVPKETWRPSRDGGEAPCAVRLSDLCSRT